MGASSTPEPKVDELRRLFEAELERQARPMAGCWPLVVAIAGLLLGLLLLATRM